MGWFDNIRFPYFNQQQLNLDWLLDAVKNALNLLPDDSGDNGDVLTKTSDGTAWEPLAALSIDIHGLPQDTEMATTDELVFYDRSAGANRKIQLADFEENNASSASPRMAGTAAPGTSKLFARGDHVHPTDTSRAPESRFTNGNLKIANGGTGASNKENAKTNLELSATLENAVPAIMGDIRIQCFQMAANETATIDLGVANRGFVVFIGSGASTRGIQLYSVNTSGSVASFTNLTSAMTAITVTRVGSTTEFEIANASSAVVWGIRVYCTGSL